MLDRARNALDLFKELCSNNPKNIYWENLNPLRQGTVFPHNRMYREALRRMVGPEELLALRRAPLHFLISAYPAWLRGRLGTIVGMSLYGLEQTLRQPIEPTWPIRAGFQPVVARPSECDTTEDFVELVIAASCVPPVLTGGRYGNYTVLDGGLISDVPIGLAEDQPGNTLVLLSRRYDRAMPAREGVTWVQPSNRIKIDKFDYANPDGLQETFDLGFKDGQRFAGGP